MMNTKLFLEKVEKRIKERWKLPNAVVDLIKFWTCECAINAKRQKDNELSETIKYYSTKRAFYYYYRINGSLTILRTLDFITEKEYNEYTEKLIYYIRMNNK